MSAITTSPFLSLSLYAACPHVSLPKLLDLTPHLSVLTHTTVWFHHPIAREGCTASPWVCPGASHKTHLPTSPVTPFAPQCCCASPGSLLGAIASFPGHETVPNVLGKLVPAPAFLGNPCSTASSLQASRGSEPGPLMHSGWLLAQ